jgi:hypothetical protein
MRSGIPTMQSYVIFTHIQLGVEFWCRSGSHPCLKASKKY